MDFIYEIPNNLSDEKCEEIIKRFEAAPTKKPGVTGGGGENPVKKSIDLAISRMIDWKDMDVYLHTQLGEGLVQYREYLQKKCKYSGLEFAFSKDANVSDTGYQIQKSVTGDYYSWHSDSMVSTNRFLTFLWYLTSHDVILNGGGTAFHQIVGDGGKIVTPERGKLLLFPATWTYSHMGLPLFQGDPKYICTGWISSNHV